jgi:arylsulfatase A-like enzyme
MRFPGRAAFLLSIALIMPACGPRRQEPGRLQASLASPYRFDDRLDSAAAVSAAEGKSAARVTDPIVWKDFHTENDVAWELESGRMGLRGGDLILKGDGAPAAIVSPREPAIDWSLFESVQIRMMAEAGSEMAIRIGPLEMRQKLAPPGVYQVYRFDIDVQAPRGSRPLAILPTDNPAALAAIDFIELVPRRDSFPLAAGLRPIAKSDERRNTIYAHAPSAITYEVQVPERARLKFGIGVAERNPVTFRILAGASGTPVFSRTLDDPERWVDAEVDLSAHAGRTARIVFETASAHPGAIGLWANPLLATAAPSTRPNVLIYLVCSMRPDHSSLYGYSRDTTPFMKELGAAGIVFEDAQAQAPWTKGSVPSLMTSIHSYTLGMRQDADTVPRGAVTLAETLRKAGYSTASVVTNPFVGRVSGLDRGFDYMMEYPVVHRQRSEEADRGTDSAALAKVANGWLERHRDEPFFLYAHTSDPHAPYRPPADLEARFANPADTAQFNRDYEALWDKRQYGGGAAVTLARCRAKGIDPETFLRRAVDRYDGEIAHADRSLRALVDKLRQLSLLDDTLVVVLSDHGEEFWDHGLTGHGHSLHQELIHAVFLMWNPRLLGAPKRIREPVQLLDLMPTVAGLLKIDLDGEVQGQSLLALVEGRAFRRNGFLASSRFAHPNPGTLAPEYAADSVALLDGDLKLIHRSFIDRNQAKRAGLNEAGLFDRRADRAETRDLAAERPADVRRLRAEVDKWVEAQKQVRKLLGPGGRTTLDPESLKRLRSLGYLGGK